MVYRGPSQACSRCRSRRVKCDLTRPSCTTCARRNESCPRYPVNLKAGEVIIDETKATIQAHQERAQMHGNKQCHKAATPAWGISDSDIFVSVCFFFNNYAKPDRGIQSTRSELKYLPSVYAAASSSSTISKAVKALTLSFLSMWRGLGPDSAESRMYMHRAITQLQRDILCPKQSVADETLLAILMLQFRDTMVGAAKSQFNEGVHQRGAYAMVKHKSRTLRGFETPLARQLMASLRNSAVFEALRSRMRVDTNVEIWKVKDNLKDDPNDALSWIGVEVAGLQAAFEESAWNFSDGGHIPSLDDLAKISTWRDTALRLERELVTWRKSQSTLWEPMVVPIADVALSIREAGMYDDYCHVYPSVSIAGIWSNYRFQRIIVLKVIICCVWALRQVSGQTATMDDPTAHRQSLQLLVDEICATVPFHLGNRVDVGSIDEFSDAEHLEYPFDSNQSLSRETVHLAGHGTFPHVNAMSTADRKREAVALGGWHILGPLGLTLRMLNEPVDVWGCGNGGQILKLAAFLREGQTRWMVSQLRRTLIVQKMIRKDSPYLRQ